jgi:pimeloyl-ACP methyl ester carboxylesterase
MTTLNVIPPMTGGVAGVTSFNGRNGVVVPVASDYDASQIDNDSSVAGAFVNDALDALLASIGVNAADIATNAADIAALQTTVGGNKVAFFPVDWNSNFNEMRSRSQGGTAAFRYSFQVPDDFGSLVSISAVVVYATGPVAGSIDLFSNYGAAGESPTNHTESDLGGNIAYASGPIQLLDLSSVFSVLGAGDFCGVQIDHNAGAGTGDYLCIRLEYTPA